MLVRDEGCFAHNKPWIASNVKDLLNKKKAFQEKNHERKVRDSRGTATGRKQRNGCSIDGNMERGNELNLNLYPA